MELHMSTLFFLKTAILTRIYFYHWQS